MLKRIWMKVKNKIMWKSKTVTPWFERTMWLIWKSLSRI